nr:protein PROCA1 [Misgurnus anguillicaudatus]
MWSVLFVFLSYLDRNFVKGEFLTSLDAEKESKELFYMLNNTMCAKGSMAGDYHLHQVTDGMEEVRSVHDSQGRLLDCSVIQNQMQVKSFMHVCRLGLREQKVNSDLKPSLTGLSEAKANCNKLKTKGDRNVIVTTKPKESDAENNNDKLRRSKRGFTYPGTLWCGAGNIADHYDQLGEFAETDKCCRVHDHCPYVIHAFSSNYGYTNFKWHSLSHCDCDNQLKECLRQVNDTSSRVVGQAFFNVIEVPCFEFTYEEQCVERHWYGMCKRYDRVPVAVIKESIPYDFGGIDVIDVLTIAPSESKESEVEKQDETQSTQSTFSESKTAGPEEPSLTNVVTAAEDFIKVLATVSTSQSSSTDTGKGETQTSERKKKKNSGKKKKENKKRRGKGKGRKKNQKLDAVLKVDEGTSAPPPASQVDEVIGKNQNIKRLSTTENNFMNGELDAVGNKMMRDDPQRTVNDSQEVVSTSASTKKDLEILQQAQENNTYITPTSHTVPTTRAKP